METYQEFLSRISAFETKKIDYGNNYFKSNPSIIQKVDTNNRFRNFFGDTIVFTLDNAIKEKLAEYVDLLYQSAPRCFCEKLNSNIFHVTLHDLSNSQSLQEVAEEIFENEFKIIGKKKELQRYKKYKIRMKSKYIFNMVNTSLVLGLYPADENEYHRLMELYLIFDKIKKLDYPFTPHITLAYYNANGFDIQAARTLEDIVNRLNNNEIEIELNVNNLYYQKFKSMNEYINIMSIIHSP